MFNSISGMCADGIPKIFGFLDFGIAPNFLYYSYIPILIATIFFGFIIYNKNKEGISNKIFLFISTFFALWIINILFQWVAIPNNIIYISWQLTALFEVPIFLLSIYFVDVFISQSDISTKKKRILIFLYLPILILMPTKLNILSYDYEFCEGKLGLLWWYIYTLEIGSLVWIGITGYVRQNKLLTNKEIKRKISILTTGVIVFLGSFSVSNIIGEISGNYHTNLVGPIGMVVFMGLISYLIVKYKSFEIKLISIQVLIWGLILLIGSQFFFIKVPINFVLTGITFILVIILGNLIIRSFKKEIEQKERLEVLRLKLEETNISLEVANEKLKSLDKLKTEFLSLASHQLRSPLTAIKGYSSMLEEGDYGNIDPKVREIIDRIFQSSNNLTLIVEDLLNVSKIEQGGMKYEMAIFDLKQLAEEIIKNLSITAENKGLKMIFDFDPSKNYQVNGDKEKIRQVIINLIDNSIKYTKVGEIKTLITIENNKIILSIKDTGMGMTKEIKDSLFQKFSRGEGARINASGSGLGLYLAKQIIEFHRGRVWVESEGPDKGSTFLVELDEVK